MEPYTPKTSMPMPPETPPPPFGPERLAKLTAWFGKSGNADPSAPGNASKVLSPFRNASVTRPHHLQIPSLLQDLLDHHASPSQTADALASHVLTAEDPNSAWSWLGGTLCRAAEHHSHPELERLANVLVHLVELPHRVPPLPGPDDGNPEGDTAFAHLPGFGATLGEWMQGPKQYFCNMEVVTRAAQLAAMRQWTNLNAFAAICTSLHCRDLLPVSVDIRIKAHVVLSQALEQDVRDADVDFDDVEYASLQDYPLLWIPAAAEWITTAGREIQDGMKKAEQLTMNPGGLWTAAGGDHRLGAERWQFWRGRMRTLTEDDRLRTEVREVVVRAARVMDELGSPDNIG